MIATILMCASASMVLLLGSLHLLFTFRGQRLYPRDPEVIALMQRTSPNLTRDTSIWRAWLGFNASHSTGAMLFGLLFGYLALCHAELLFTSAFLLTIGFLHLAVYLWLAKRFWFRIPLAGMTFALVCYVAAVAASRVAIT